MNPSDLSDAREAEFEVRLANEDDSHAIVDFMIEHYAPREPVHLAFKIVPESMRNLYESVVENSLKSKTAHIVVHSPSKQIVGTSLNHIMSKSDRKPFAFAQHKDPLVNRMATTILSYTASLDFFDNDRVDKVLKMGWWGVRKDCSGKRLIYKMLEESEKAGIRAGCQRSAVQVGNFISKHVAEKMNYKIIKEIHFEEFEFNGQKIEFDETYRKTLYTFLDKKLVPALDLREASEKEFLVRMATDDDREEIVELLLNDYAKREPLGLALKCLPEDLHKMFINVAKGSIHSKTAFIAIHQPSSLVVGSSLSHIMTKDDPAAFDVSESNLKVLKYLAPIEEEMASIDVFGGIDKVLEMAWWSVRADCSGRQLIYKMLKGSENAGIKSGCKRAFVQTTNPASKHVAEKMNYRIMKGVSYDHLKYKGEPLDIDPKGYKGELTILCKELDMKH